MDIQFMPAEISIYTTAILTIMIHMAYHEATATSICTGDINRITQAATEVSGLIVTTILISKNAYLSYPCCIFSC